MKKKTLIIFLLMIVLLTGCSLKIELKKEEPVEKKTAFLFELDNYKDLKLEKVTSLDIIRYTVAGDNKKGIVDKEEIASYYQRLSQLKIGEQTNRACEDNTIVYVFHTKDGKYSIEFECEWLVLQGKRYNIVK